MKKKIFKVYIQVYMEVEAPSKKDVLSMLQDMDYDFTESESDKDTCEIQRLEIQEWLDENEVSYDDYDDEEVL